MPTKIYPYHTSVPEYGGERDVYHDYNECPTGRRIKAEHRTQGEANRPRCKDCKALD